MLHINVFKEVPGRRPGTKNRPGSTITLPVPKYHAIKFRIKFLIVSIHSMNCIRPLTKVSSELHAPTVSRRGGGNAALNSGAMRSLASVSATLRSTVLKTGSKGGVKKTQGNGKVNGRFVDIPAICHTHTLCGARGNAWSSGSGPPLRLHAITLTQKQLYHYPYADTSVWFKVLIATDSDAVTVQAIRTTVQLFHSTNTIKN